jgi:hypothetical protein
MRIKRFIAVSVVLCLILVSIGIIYSPVKTRAAFTNFITRSGDKLMDGEDEYKFISVNMLSALTIHSFKPDYLYGDGSFWWILPDDLEMESCVKMVSQMGGRVFRSFNPKAAKCTDSQLYSVMTLMMEMQTAGRLMLHGV